MNPNDIKVVSTDEVIQRLESLGLRVTKTMLDNDVHDHFLPPRPWPAWVMRRAERLYRLRRRGAKGDVLRVLLFVHDGKLWHTVRPVALAGLEKNIKANQVGIREVIRQPTRQGLETVLPDAIERHHQHLINRIGPENAGGVQTRSSTMGFAWGIGLFGKPLGGGSMKTLEPLMRAMNPDWDAETTTVGRELTEETFATLSLTWEKQLSIIESADEAIAATALPMFWRQIKNQRRFVREAALKDGKPGQCTNPLSMFGYFKQSLRDGFWEKMPERLTPAQMLAAQVGMTLMAMVSIDSSLPGMAFKLWDALMADAENSPEDN